jgi:hypothetical protein
MYEINQEALFEGLHRIFPQACYASPPGLLTLAECDKVAA